MKIALLAGHARKKEGAVCCAGYYKAFGEWALARTYIYKLQHELENLGYDVEVTEREDAGGLSPSYSALAANATGADIAIELHFNSASPDTKGAEALYYAEVPNPKGKKFAELIGQSMAEILGVKHRGAKGLKAHNRGFSAVKKSKMPFFLLEPCFAGSNPDEARIFGNAIKEGTWHMQLAQAIHKAITTVYGD